MDTPNTQPKITEVLKRIRFKEYYPTTSVGNSKPTNTGHGLNGFDSCLYCDNEINNDNPGKLVIFKTRQEIICNSCFMDPDYKEIIEKYKPIVKNYEV